MLRAELMQESSEYAGGDDGCQVGPGERQGEHPLAAAQQREQQRRFAAVALVGGAELAFVGHHHRDFAGGEESLHQQASGDRGDERA